MNANRNGNHRLQRLRPGADRRGGRPRPKAPGQGGRQGGNSSANAQRNYERYMALAREAALSGDTVEMENCYQHAEHYFRVMRERSA
jgi:hypothetical protein